MRKAQRNKINNTKVTTPKEKLKAVVEKVETKTKAKAKKKDK